MGNPLFQQARKFVGQFLNGGNSSEQPEKLEVAKNAISSAFANSTPAEQAQLSELQHQLEDEDFATKK
ncbi:DUF3813 domain-containing protein [Bacillus sp. CECT 9360]|uniref:DUF3813 domain-containing protein n=1 Tax=Bacillus sp. CECT 9360 TaxID=2845821 RepID=UPI001E4D13C6|nr:DUF3813 domain-containing protein [Bacillus sp. CECT 9360]CAH0344448.1 hypothetical protein BCI9360_00703 [Bacillus sp. CECT 9360]